jgi:hypothetical protein
VSEEQPKSNLLATSKPKNRGERNKEEKLRREKEEAAREKEELRKESERRFKEKIQQKMQEWDRKPSSSNPVERARQIKPSKKRKSSDDAVDVDIRIPKPINSERKSKEGKHKNPKQDVRRNKRKAERDDETQRLSKKQKKEL